MVSGNKAEGDAAAEYRFENIQVYVEFLLFSILIFLFFNVEILTQKNNYGQRNELN